MDRFGTGQAIRRKEDERFLTGTGQYTDDIRMPATPLQLWQRLNSSTLQ